MFKINWQNSNPQCFATKVIRQQKLHIEGKQVILRTNIRYYPHSEIISLITLNAMFLSLSYARLTLYSTGDDTGCQKTGRFSAAVHPPSQWQTNQQMPGLFFFLLTLARYFCSFDETQFDLFFFFSPRIKYDDSRNRNNCVMRTNSIVGFDSI